MESGRGARVVEAGGQVRNHGCIDLGALGQGQSVCPVRLKPVSPIPNVPKTGIIATIPRDERLYVLHEALCNLLGTPKDAVTLGRNGRDVDLGETLANSGALGTTTRSEARRSQTYVDFVFLVKMDVQVQLNLPALPDGNQCAQAASSSQGTVPRPAGDQRAPAGRDQARMNDGHPFADQARMDDGHPFAENPYPVSRAPSQAHSQAPSHAPSQAPSSNTAPKGNPPADPTERGNRNGVMRAPAGALRRACQFFGQWFPGAR